MSKVVPDVLNATTHILGVAADQQAGEQLHPEAKALALALALALAPT